MFVPVLPKLMESYNRSYHRNIKMTPDQVTLADSEQVWEKMYFKTKKQTKKSSLKVSNRVRQNKNFWPFKKSYLPGWTKEVFVVRKLCPGQIPVYKIEGWDWTCLDGTFYDQDLQKVKVTENNIFRIEQIVNDNKVLVNWKSWPHKYSTRFFYSKVNFVENAPHFACSLLRATACKYGESSDRTTILVFVLFHRKHPFGELLSKIVLKSSIARLFLWKIEKLKISGGRPLDPPENDEKRCNFR